MYTKGKNPLYVVTTLGIGASEAKKIYMDYLDLKGCYHLVEVLQQFNRGTIQNFSKAYMTNDNRIDKKNYLKQLKSVLIFQKSKKNIVVYPLN